MAGMIGDGERQRRLAMKNGGDRERKTLAVPMIEQHCDLISASRLPKLHPPAMPIPTLRNPKPPSSGRFILNRYKKSETEAFRPTTPGISPGTGHLQPPSAP
ncbi:hypothetical protein F0562_011785 [Nyssa sinensis]|uniref:Uncharacterized protein n=1 Tax=Nyssa sinensis TaxID=561372 RepID=A0A5J4ZUJ0_9ASTE|nr:hypothetical protein F0562_011785 [Nyssa sinensis]